MENDDKNNLIKPSAVRPGAGYAGAAHHYDSGTARGGGRMVWPTPEEVDLEAILAEDDLMETGTGAVGASSSAVAGSSVGAVHHSGGGAAAASAGCAAEPTAGRGAGLTRGYGLTGYVAAPAPVPTSGVRRNLEPKVAFVFKAPDGKIVTRAERCELTASSGKKYLSSYLRYERLIDESTHRAGPT